MRASVFASFASLAVASVHPHRGAQNVSSGKRGVDISSYTMPGAGSYASSGSAAGSSILSAGSDYVETATELVKKTAPGLTFRLVDDHYVGANGVAHVNFKQTVNGVDVDNADFNVNIAADGKIFSHGNNFYNGTLPEASVQPASAKIRPVDALKGAVSILGLPIELTGNSSSISNMKTAGAYTISGSSGVVGDPNARLVYIHNGSDSDLKLTWRVETDTVDNWLLSYVDAATADQVHGVVDYVSDVASYKVYPWNTDDPSQGERSVLKEPWLISTSPFTWIGDGKSYTTTRGNNAIAQVNPTGGGDFLNNYRPDNPKLAFEYPYSLTEADPLKYQDASITQLFYTVNKLHDLLYVLGFQEQAGNFESNNNGKGGKGGDQVILNTQDGSGLNNANFATPPDGGNGRMRMYMWDQSSPKRDGSFDSGIVIHEYIHGLSSRLTGGPANAGCLSGKESSGMAEGWSDFFSAAIRLKPKDTRTTDHVIGAWVYNRPGGIRTYPYSTNMKTNPLTYGQIEKLGSSHEVGTIWATILYEILWNLIDKYGKNDNDFPKLDAKGKPSDGKFLAMKIVQDALALQPCNPSFIAARDAIIDADKALTGGQNKCELWAGFAKRGMGAKAATSPRTEDYNRPAGC